MGEALSVAVLEGKVNNSLEAWEGGGRGTAVGNNRQTNNACTATSCCYVHPT